MRRVWSLILLGGIVLSAHNVGAVKERTVQPSFFPLAPGSEWIYSVSSTLFDTIVRYDTIRVDDFAHRGNQTYYHLTTPWFAISSAWIASNADGDLYWYGSPGKTEHPLLMFSVPVGTVWPLEGRHCIDAAIRVPPSYLGCIHTAQSDDLICLASYWRPGDCYDAYWYAQFAEDIGPVLFSMCGVGVTWTWELVEFRPGPPCHCRCHANPICDAWLDTRDVIMTIDVAFGGAQPKTDRGCWCYAHALHGRTDVDCSGATDAMDVIRMIDVVFAGADPASMFCRPEREACGGQRWRAVDVR